MKRAGFMAAIIVLANLALATLMYMTVGWHFIRGYNEVINFAIVPCVVVQAALNSILATPIALAAWRRRTSGARIILATFCLSAAIVLLSPTFAPILGSAANRNLWIKTPLHWAVEHRANVMTIKLLVNYGANPALEDWHGKTPLEYTNTIPDPVGREILDAMHRGMGPRKERPIRPFQEEPETANHHLSRKRS